MEVPFFVAFSVILLLGRYLPFALPPTTRAVLADNAAGPACTARYAVSVAVAGLMLLVSTQCSAGGGQAQPQQCPAEVAMEGRVLWLNSAALFLGMVLGSAAVALHPPARVPPFVLVAVDHLARATETIAITAFAHDVCIFLKVLKVKQ